MPKDSEGAEEGDMMRAKGLLLPDGYFLLVGQSAFQLRETSEVIVRAFGWGLLVTVILGLIGGVLMSTGMLRRVESDPRHGPGDHGRQSGRAHSHPRHGR